MSAGALAALAVYRAALSRAFAAPRRARRLHLLARADAARRLAEGAGASSGAVAAVTLAVLRRDG